MTTTIDLSRYRLDRGGHNTIDDGMCAMELASHLAGEHWGAAPACVCHTLRVTMIMANDGMDDETRNRLLLPLVPSVLNTHGSAELALRRSVLVLDWCQRIALPSLLDRVGVLQPYAAQLRALPEAVTPTAVADSQRRVLIRNADTEAGKPAHAADAWRVATAAATASRVGALNGYFGNPARAVALEAVAGRGLVFEETIITVFAAMPAADVRKQAVRDVWELYPELIRRMVAVKETP